MAVKRRGPGRPPKPRGPGRPKGSKNKIKRLRPSVAARIVEKPPTIGLPLTRRGRGRPRTKNLPITAKTVLPFTSKQALAELQRMTQQYFERCEEEWGDTREKIAGMIQRVERVEREHRAMKADADHPTTRTLAQRLITLETSEKITQSAHERMERMESELHKLRHELSEIVAEQHNVRNFAEVAKLAADTAEDTPQDQQTFELDDVNAGRTRSGSEM
jgi:uncharacterized protein (UPF0335 family)